MTHALVLTAAAPLPDALLEAAGTAAGVRFRRLAPEAAEAEAAPAALDPLRAAVGHAADANAVPLVAREKRALVADMDSTIIGCECIDEIAAMAGVGPAVAEITERAMRGELDFEGSLEARVALLAGVEADLLERVRAERVRLNPGARRLVRTMAARGAATALVSGGFTVFADRVAEEAGFALARANRLEVGADGRLTGRVVPPILGRDAKREALLVLAAERGLDLAETLAVGDGANDLAMVETAGLGVAYRAKPALAERADAVLARSDLSAILHLQGIPAAAFVD